jgi:hypothetical protein
MCLAASETDNRVDANAGLGDAEAQYTLVSADCGLSSD